MNTSRRNLVATSDIGHWQNSGVNPVDGVKILKGRFFSDWTEGARQVTSRAAPA